MKITAKEISRNKKIRTVVILFIILALWRIFLFLFHSDQLSFAWGASYQIIAIYGAITGFKLAKAWGGRKSILGKTILMFSFGLLLQAFGQSVSSYLVLTTGTVSYPSIGDLGFFGSIPFYIYGVYLIGKLSGMNISLRKFDKKILAVAIIAVVLAFSYFIFLYGYEHDWSNQISVFLDFGYPLGQAIYVSIAAVAFIFIFPKNTLGGMMRGPILLFLGALIMQYASDFVFLYQSSKNIYIPEGLNDCMYFVAYFLMAISIIRLSIVFDYIQKDS